MSQSAAPLLRLDHDGPVTSVAMTPDGLIGISGSLDRTVRVWDLRPDRGLGVHRLDGHTGPVFAVAFGPDNRLVLSGGGDRTIRLWDLKTGRPDGQPLASRVGRRRPRRLARRDRARGLRRRHALAVGPQVQAEGPPS